jgi:hypothetical protein
MFQGNSAYFSQTFTKSSSLYNFNLTLIFSTEKNFKKSLQSKFLPNANNLKLGVSGAGALNSQLFYLIVILSLHTQKHIQTKTGFVILPIQTGDSSKAFKLGSLVHC